ncbi:hypothetical protein B0H16DRAFT_1789482, partial [Mycena metata]
ISGCKTSWARRGQRIRRWTQLRERQGIKSKKATGSHLLLSHVGLVPTKVGAAQTRRRTRRKRKKILGPRQKMSLRKKIKRKGECRQIRTASLQNTHQHALPLSHVQYTRRTSSPSRRSGAGAGERDGEPLFLGTDKGKQKLSRGGARGTKRAYQKHTKRGASISRRGRWQWDDATAELSNVFELGGWDGDVHALGHIHLVLDDGKRVETRADAARTPDGKEGESSERGNACSKERPPHRKPLPRISAKGTQKGKKNTNNNRAE